MHFVHYKCCCQTSRKRAIDHAALIPNCELFLDEEGQVGLRMVLRMLSDMKMLWQVLTNFVNRVNCV